MWGRKGGIKLKKNRVRNGGGIVEGIRKERRRKADRNGKDKGKERGMIRVRKDDRSGQEKGKNKG